MGQKLNSFKRRLIKRTVQRGGVMAWSCFEIEVTSSCRNRSNHEFCTLPENPKGECPVISLWLELCSRAMIQNTPASPPLNGSKPTHPPKITVLLLKWMPSQNLHLNLWHSVAWLVKLSSVADFNSSAKNSYTAMGKTHFSHLPVIANAWLWRPDTRTHSYIHAYICAGIDTHAYIHAHLSDHSFMHKWK